MDTFIVENKRVGVMGGLTSPATTKVFQRRASLMVEETGALFGRRYTRKPPTQGRNLPTVRNTYDPKHGTDSKVTLVGLQRNEMIQADSSC